MENVASGEKLEDYMLKIVALVTAAGFLAMTAAPTIAAPKNTPGHKMQARGSVPGYPGASGYAPGQVKKMRANRGHSASAFAPGHRKRR